MGAITMTAADCRPLDGAIIRRFTAAGSGSIGDLVYVDSDGKVAQADADAAATAYGRGIVMGNVNNPGATTFVAADVLSVLVFGPVTGFSAMGEGEVFYSSATAGAIDDTAHGTYPHKVGWSISATVLFFCPALTEV